MKFTLISPYPDFRTYGLRSISTFLRRKGVEVSTIYLLRNYNTLYRKETLDRLIDLASDSDLIGVSLMSNYFMNAAQIAGAIKEKFDTPVVFGGVHPTVAPRECLEHCDIAVIGEGEETLLELLRARAEGRPLRNIPGAWVKDGGKIFENKTRPLLPIEELPSIDNDFSADYVLSGDRITALNDKNLKRFMTSDYMTLTSFGCPFSCSYCINNRLNRMYGGKIRFRKIDDVISELVSAKDRMPFIRQVTFDDDAFIRRELDELREFARRYRAEVNLPFFVSGVNPLFVTEEKIKLLVDAGMNRIKMGIQSGSERIKELYNRPVPNEKIVESAKIIRRHRKSLVLTAFDLILDNPFETAGDIRETIELLTKLPAPFTLNLSSLTFFPGTELYEKAVAVGFVKNNTEDVYRKLYHGVDHTYLNFVILLFTIGKVPSCLLKVLLAGKFAEQRKRKIPKTIFRLFQLIGFGRRGLSFLFKGDPYTLLRLIKYNPLAP